MLCSRCLFLSGGTCRSQTGICDRFGRGPRRSGVAGLAEPALSGWDQNRERADPRKEHGQTEDSMFGRNHRSCCTPADQGTRRDRQRSLHGASALELGRCSRDPVTDAVEHPLGPLELGREDHQAGGHHNDAGPGKNQHRQPSAEHHEASDDNQHPLGARCDPPRPVGNCDLHHRGLSMNAERSIEGLSHSVEPGCRDRLAVRDGGSSVLGYSPSGPLP